MDECDEKAEGLDKFPETDIFRLLHFAEWMVAEKRVCNCAIDAFERISVAGVGT